VECRSHFGGAFRPHSAAVPLDNPRDGRQADSAARKIGAGVQPLKSLKETLARRHVEAGAVVPDEVNRLSVLFHFAELDPRAGMLSGELPGVFEEIEERGMEQSRVAG